MNGATNLEHKSQQQPGQARRRTLAWPMRQASTGLAITVRGSSRRIMIMRFRPANIRLINRRSSLLQLLLALSSGNNKSKDKNKPTHRAG